MLQLQTVLPDTLELLNTQKYPNYSLFRALLSLTYFDDAEQQAMPKMLANASWEKIKSTITKEVSKLQK